MESSFALGEVKSYLTFAWGLEDAGGAAAGCAGGGGGGTRVVELFDSLRLWVA